VEPAVPITASAALQAAGATERFLSKSSKPGNPKPPLRALEMITIRNLIAAL
jgi:hypothetical protein